MMMIVDKDKFREEISEYVDKYGQIETTITKLNIALERSSKPLVLCKECKWMGNPSHCPDRDGLIDVDGFCDWGEKEDD